VWKQRFERAAESAARSVHHASLEDQPPLGIYGHRDESDLETAMDSYARWLERDGPVVPLED
jgi:hypothetical protein